MVWLMQSFSVSAFWLQHSAEPHFMLRGAQRCHFSLHQASLSVLLRNMTFDLTSLTWLLTEERNIIIHYCWKYTFINCLFLLWCSNFKCCQHICFLHIHVVFDFNCNVPSLFCILFTIVSMCCFSALIALGFLVIHTFSMIIAFNAYDEKKKCDQIVVPVVHLAAAVMVRN